MNDNYGYLERGTLIQKGTMLKVWNKYSDKKTLNGLYIVSKFEHFNRGDHTSFSVEVKPIKVKGFPDKSYTRSDLQDLVDSKLLVVYNES